MHGSNVVCKLIVHFILFCTAGVMYSRYRPEKLFDHIRAYASRLNVSKMLRAW